MKKIYGLLLGAISLLVLGLAFPSLAATATTGTFTGALSQYLQTQETALNASFNSGYDALYAQFSKTGLAILKSVDYQSLVCLGGMPADSVLSLMQKDKLTLKIAMNKDFSELRSRATSLEEKYRLQSENAVNLFGDSTYEIESQNLKTVIDTTIGNHSGSVQNYLSGYKTKIKSFFSDYVLYSAQNKELIKTMSARIAKVQYVQSGFSAIENKIASLYSSMDSLGTLQNFALLKDLALKNLAAKLDSVIASRVRIYSKLTNLSGELAIQKQAELNQYALDMDEQINSVLQKRYDRTAYLKVKDKVTTVQSKYFTNQNLICTAIISSDDDAAIAPLMQEIANLSTNVSSGIAAMTSSGNRQLFQTALINKLKTLYTTVAFQQKIAAFQKNITPVIRNLQSLLTNVTSPSTTTTTTGATSGYILPVGFTFARPLKLNSSYPEVETLQKFLTNQGLYSGALSTIFTQATKDALYAFQLQQGILTTSSNTDLHGLLGPATRAALNKLMNN